jgi:hypothetical protein
VKPRFLLAALLTLTALMIIPSGAGAYRFAVESPNSATSNYLYDIDPNQNFTVRVMDGAVQTYTVNQPAGASDYYFYATVNDGNTIEIFQPQGALTPSGSFTVPPVTVTPAAGSPTVTGSAPNGWGVHVRTDPPCNGESVLRSTTAAGGSYSLTFPTPAVPGEHFTISAVSPIGDWIGRWGQVGTQVPGDGNCIWADAKDNVDPFDAQPYGFGVYALDTSAIATTRIVLRRGGTILADRDATNMDLPKSIKPTPGDVIEVYRPKTAGSPSYSWTIPQISELFDAGNDLVAIDAPAAHELAAEVCRPFVCGPSPEPSALNTAAGRTIFDFAHPERGTAPYDIQPDTQVTGWWVAADSSRSYDFSAVPGDLTAPSGRLTMPKSLKARKLRNKLKFKFVSSEAGRQTSKLTLDPATGGAAAAKKPVVLATGSGPVKAGTNTLSLKIGKSGKKALKAVVKQKKNRRATLTVAVTDSAGNSTTVVKSTTLKPGG